MLNEQIWLCWLRLGWRDNWASQLSNTVWREELSSWTSVGRPELRNTEACHPDPCHAGQGRAGSGGAASVWIVSALSLPWRFKWAWFCLGVLGENIEVCCRVPSTLYPGRDHSPLSWPPLLIMAPSCQLPTILWVLLCKVKSQLGKALSDTLVKRDLTGLSPWPLGENMYIKIFFRGN